MNLYELSKEYLDVINNVDEDGCIDENGFDKIKGDMDSKINNIGKILRMYSAKVKSIDEEIEKLNKNKKVAINNGKRLKEYLDNILQNLNMNKYETNLFKFYYKSSSSIEIDDGVLLEERFSNIKVYPDKTKIKEALLNGEQIEGCRIVEKQNLQMK